MDNRSWHRFYETRVPPDIDFEDVPIPRYLDRSAARYPDAPALIFMNRRLTYRQLKDEVDRLATAFAALGVEKDSKVAIQLPNLPQAVIAHYATLSLGAQVVMTNPLYVEREIEHQWNDADCCLAVVADYLFERRIKNIRDKLPVKHYVIASIPEYLGLPHRLLAPRKLKKANPPLVATVQADERTHLMRRLIKTTPPKPPQVEIGMDDIAVLQYTGGTTGVSKGAMLTHRNLSYNVQQAGAWFTSLERGKEVWLSCLPLFHAFGMTVSMNFPVYAGCAMVLIPDPRAISQMIKSIARHRVTMLPAVPALFNAIANHARARKLDLTSVKFCVCGSAPLPAAVRERFESITGGLIAEGFGLTETSPMTHANPLLGKRKAGSIGVPFPGTDAKVVALDDARTEVPPGEEGELLIKGPQVMKGYWNRPDVTEETIRDGWLHTGDIAMTDEDGYFYIVGRKKDVIISGGYNVYPDEVDDVLSAHPAVLEAATIGVPHVRRGETVKAFVVLKDKHTVTTEELVKYSRKQLAAYKIPRQIEFRDSLPKSAALKILRRELREQELAKHKDHSRGSAS
jgi:long-chain acyl-CoA synthetase